MVSDVLQYTDLFILRRKIIKIVENFEDISAELHSFNSKLDGVLMIIGFVLNLPM